MSEKLFEVFLGTFNAEPWIEKVIHSLEAQDSEPFSVKIIDNASTDNTVEIVKNLFENYSFRNSYELILNKKNIGAISTFLDRLDIFDAEWVIMIHQDDYYHSDHISTLVTEIRSSNKSLGTIFTAMQRMNANNVETASIPSLSPLISETNRIENFLLTLQLSPINFPTCALRKSILHKVSTSRHTTAFNDVELLLKMMCISDVKYIAKETIHYRVHSGNAASITSTKSNDLAISVGLVELFHSPEVISLLHEIEAKGELSRLVKAMESALNIRILDEKIRLHTKFLLSESLIRIFGYSKVELFNFLKESLKNLELNREIQTAQNLFDSAKFEQIHLRNVLNNPQFSQTVPGFTISQQGSVQKTFNNLPLALREKIFQLTFFNPLFSLVKRPFVKVWRSRGKSE